MLKYPNAVIQVFCKAPVPGTVKTRLQPELNAEQAAEVHKQLTRQILDLVYRAELCAIQLWCSPDTSHPFFAELANEYPISLKTQSEGNLGSRMNQALTEQLKQYQQAVLIGCDCPSFTLTDIEAALLALNKTHDAVLASTEDSGYSLIGLKRPEPKLFQAIKWSTDEVLPQTRTKIQHLKLNCFELPTQWDVDTYADYLRFIRYSNQPTDIRHEIVE